MIVSCENKLWELVCSFVFIFDHVRVGTDSERGLLVLPVYSLVYGCDIEHERSEVAVWFKLPEREFAENRISLTFYMQDNGIVFIIVF